MRHGVNLATHLQFKTSPTSFDKANKAADEHIKRASRILAMRGWDIDLKQLPLQRDRTK